MAKELWHKAVRGRVIEGCAYEVSVSVGDRGVGVACAMQQGSSPTYVQAAYLTVDMARDLRAAIDEAIERASAG